MVRDNIVIGVYDGLPIPHPAPNQILLIGVNATGNIWAATYVDKEYLYDEDMCAWAIGMALEGIDRKIASIDSTGEE